MTASELTQSVVNAVNDGGGVFETGGFDFTPISRHQLICRNPLLRQHLLKTEASWEKSLKGSRRRTEKDRTFKLLPLLMIAFKKYIQEMICEMLCLSSCLQ